jgi:hypothetical protein
MVQVPEQVCHFSGEALVGWANQFFTPIALSFFYFQTAEWFATYKPSNQTWAFTNQFFSAPL